MRQDPWRRLCSQEYCHAPESQCPQPLPIASAGPQRKVHIVRLVLPTSLSYTTGHHSAWRVGGLFPPTKQSLKFKYQICAVKAQRKQPLGRQSELGKAVVSAQLLQGV